MYILTHTHYYTHTTPSKMLYSHPHQTGVYSLHFGSIKKLRKYDTSLLHQSQEHLFLGTRKLTTDSSKAIRSSVSRASLLNIRQLHSKSVQSIQIQRDTNWLHCIRPKHLLISSPNIFPC